VKTITRQKLLDLDVCYDPAEVGLTDGMELTPVEFIDEFRNNVRWHNDILWPLLSNECMTDRELRLFAVWCARNALAAVDSPDPRSVAACDVAELYANGKAPTARAAARDATWAAWEAEGEATWAAWEAARAARAAWEAEGEAQINRLRAHFSGKEPL